MRRNDIPSAVVAARYRAGESTLQLAVAYNTGSTTITRRLTDAGLERRHTWHKRGGPLHSIRHGYLATYGRNGKQVLVHRGCWEAHHGPIPKGTAIHHMNGDVLDNRVENLRAMPRSEHAALHGKQRTRVALPLASLIEGRSGGASYREIGDAYGVSWSTVRRRLAEVGL